MAEPGMQLEGPGTPSQSAEVACRVVAHRRSVSQWTDYIGRVAVERSAASVPGPSTCSSA